jgi:pimeloyl-ACP methyl ester carboxylesterase
MTRIASLDRRALLAGSLFAAMAAPRRAASQGRPGIARWRHYADCRYGQIHVTSAAPEGSEKTPLVCLHQSPASGDYYREFQMVMAADRLVMCPDTPGYGGSDPPDVPPDVSDLADAMADAMDNLGYGTDGLGPLDWLGFHTGNYVIVELAIRRPDLVRRLVMPGIPYYPAGEREAKRKQFAQPRPYFTDADYVGQLYKDTVFNRDDGETKQRLFDMFVERLRAGPNSWWGFDAVFRYDADAALPKVTQPVLCPILNETLAEPTRQAAQLMPNANTVDLTDLTGAAWHNAPERIAAVVRPFLDQE